MISDGTPGDPIDDGVAVSVKQMGGGRRWVVYAYAALIAVAWLGLAVAAVVVVGLLVRYGAPEPRPAVILIWVAVFAGVVMTWLLWTYSLPVFADLASGGRFSAWRERRLRRFDTIFNCTAFVVLLPVVLLPFVQLVG